MAGRKSLTPDERERIVELRLQRVPVRAVAKDVGTTTTTVTRVWQKYLEERTTARKQDMDRQLSEVLARHEQIAIDARKLYLRSLKEGNLSQANAFLGQERGALTELARLGGLDPTRIEMSGALNVQVERAQAATFVQVFSKVIDTAAIPEEARLGIRQALTKELRKLAGDAGA